MIRMMLFDLDETLYPPRAGVMPEIRRMMLRYLCEEMGLPEEEAEALRRRYFATYGTTMRGLQLNHQIDPEVFLRYVHDIPLERYVRPNPALDAVLAGIPQEKVVFTNASREHAERVLELLGIRPRFSRVIDVRDVGYESKPQPAAYRRACELLGLPPGECLIVEDNLRNLEPAKAMGMTTVLVEDGAGSAEGGADVHIHRIEEIGEVMARLNAPPSP